jgi:hypothetical protein
VAEVKTFADEAKSFSPGPAEDALPTHIGDRRLGV